MTRLPGVPRSVYSHAALPAQGAVAEVVMGHRSLVAYRGGEGARWRCTALSPQQLAVPTGSGLVVSSGTVAEICESCRNFLP